jgi:hypothetical protein
MINDMNVGMENLPNVFIDKVQVYSDGSGGGAIKVLLMMYDHSSSPSWDREDIDVKVKVVFESRPEQISNLNTGIKSLFDYEPSPVGISTTNNYDSYVFSTLEFSKIGMDGEYSIYTKSLEYVKPLRQNLNVYVACFVDGFEFGIPMFDKFYGPMSGERIFVGGQLNTLSNYFYYPDTNKEYGGPVHQKPDGSYMEGSEHNQQPHKEVRLVSEENYKIQGFGFFDIGLAPSDMGDIASAGNLRDFLGTDRQAGRPGFGVTAREYNPQSTIGPSDPTLFNPNAAVTGPSIEDPNVPDSPPDRIY